MSRLVISSEALARMFSRGGDTQDCTYTRPCDPMVDDDFPDGTYLLTMSRWGDRGPAKLRIEGGVVIFSQGHRGYTVGKTAVELRNHARQFQGTLLLLHDDDTWDPLVRHFRKGRSWPNSP